jgi:hypothetical protein
VLSVVGVLGLTLLAVADPNTNLLFPPCMWRAATGWLCPGCGSARAIHALLHGQVYLAVHTNAFAVAALPLGAADVVQRLRRDESLLTHRVRPAHVRAIAVGVALFGVVRNLPM